MPFNNPEENQDKNAAPETELEPDYPGGSPRIASNMSAGILPVGSPTRILLPGARSAFWQMRPQSAVRGQGFGHPITDIGQEQASPLGGAFSLGRGMRPPQREEIGYRILGLNAEPAKNLTVRQPQSLPNANPQDWRTRLNSSKSLFLPQTQALPSGYGSFFSSFVPAGASASGDESTRASQTAFVRGQQTPIGAPQTGQSSEPQVIPVKKTPSKIQQGTVPEIKPNYKVIGKIDQAGIKKRLGQLTRGLDNPALTPMGIAPDGAPMIDVTYMTKAPSRIPRQYESGKNFSNINIDLIKHHEGGTRRHGYVPPKAKGGKNEPGVTIAAGFDLGQYSPDQIRGFGFSKDLVARLLPYAELTAQAAKDALSKRALAVTAAEAAQINKAVLDSNLNAAAEAFDEAAGHRPGDFSRLPWQAQTVIADLWYNMGHLPSRKPKVAPEFWKQVTTGDWEGAHRNLMNFSRKDIVLFRRARNDAKLLRDAIDIGWLPSY